MHEDHPVDPVGAGEGLPELRVVAGALVREGRVLAARRSPSMALPGCWELPGGKVEPGETDAEALARELAEELGVEVTVREHLGTSRTVQPGRLLVLVAYRCELVRGTPSPKEHDALRWLGAEAAGALGWAPADVPLVSTITTLLDTWRTKRL